ncbi:outer membrane scaffolding protein for murein synthesis (MipA/OmpV family) [Paraburkholderia sp. BL6669N2]|uniref:MipA/OmpV family protein n=1 Tax=Paraburkholderia sp. BL6669N2 TaxID=1938807 RepID=UPI000E26E3E5|nr:outer membrane scaffolding protein for murein synthesis (MipA/OmpV family) [Paraburkholderia sp. BL6669N2]
MRQDITTFARRYLALAAVTACCTMGVAHADEPQADSDWKISVGPGMYVFPKFPGSSKLQKLPFPVQDISWKERFFSQGPDVLGVNVLHGENYHFGMSVSFDFQSRSSSDDARLRGLPDVHHGPKLRLFGDYTWWAFTGALAAYQDIAGTGQGLTAMADLFVSAPVGNWLISMGPGLTWANATYTQTLFGITPQESAASGLPHYDTGSGLRDIHFNVNATYKINPHWSANVAVVAGRLERYAAGSPITERRLDLNGMASVLYRF